MLDTLNKFLVSLRGGHIYVLKPPAPGTPLSPEDCIQLAAWLVILSGSEDKFQEFIDQLRRA